MPIMGISALSLSRWNQNIGGGWRRDTRENLEEFHWVWPFIMGQIAWYVEATRVLLVLVGEACLNIGSIRGSKVHEIGPAEFKRLTLHAWFSLSFGCSLFAPMCIYRLFSSLFCYSGCIGKGRIVFVCLMYYRRMDKVNHVNNNT